MNLENTIRRVQGPILVLGASGHIGASLLRMILKHREDAFGTVLHIPAWRLDGLPSKHILQADLLVDSNLDHVLDHVNPKTVFDCTAYGAYSFEKESDLIYTTNFNLVARLLRRLETRGIACYVHAGSSSEYGEKSAAPAETEPPLPNSDYSVSKVAASNLISYYGKKRQLPCANLRLYAVYGPLEDSSRFIPTLVRRGSEGRFPDLVNPRISRDFVYVDDVCEAFVTTALNLRLANFGESFNIGTGHKTTIEQAAKTAAKVFGIQEAPKFQTMPNQDWDLEDWYAQPRKAREVLGWEARTDFVSGLKQTAEWYAGLPDKDRYHRSSKKFGLDVFYSVSAVVACHMDAARLPALAQSLRAAFEKLKVDYEIIFADNNSTDDTEAVLADLTRQDHRVIGVTHSRDFGSQAAFRSGMEIATKNACVLLEGHLQDPPDLIEQFVAKWREGFDVVYGRLAKRNSPFLIRLAYKIFYLVFNNFSYLSIPREAGDFCLLDRRVVRAILQFPERDFFLRGVRAFVGFKQTGVDYLPTGDRFRGETYGILKNFSRAKKGLLSFSYAPLNFLTFCGTIFFFVSVLLGLLQLLCRIYFPDLVPKGITTVLLVSMFFGAFNLFAMAILGEYIERIFEEVKHRPHYLRRAFIRNGEVRTASTDSIDKPV